MAHPVAHEGNPRFDDITITAGSVLSVASLDIEIGPFQSIPLIAPPAPLEAGDCPECDSSTFNLSIVCCPIQGGPTCDLTCDTPVLVKACGGTPPYEFSTDEEFLTVGQVLADEAIVGIRLRYTQFIYRLKFTRILNTGVGQDAELNCLPASDHSGATVFSVGIKQVNKGYDCNMVELPFDGSWGDLLVDTQDCDNCGCYDAFDETAELAKAVSRTSFTNISGVQRTDVTRTYRLYSANPSGLNITFDVDGSHCPAFGASPIEIDFPTGVFGVIPHDPTDVTVTDATDAEATLTFTF